MKYDDLPTTGSWWPYFDFADGKDSNLALLSSLPAMRALNAAIFERGLFSAGYIWTSNEYYNIMKNAVRGVSIVPSRTLPANIYELNEWTRSLDFSLSGRCAQYYDINGDNYSDITLDDLDDYRYSFNTLLSKACDILDMDPIPYGNNQKLTPYFLKEYALQRYVMLNLCKVLLVRRGNPNSMEWTHKVLYFQGVSDNEFLNGTPSEDWDLPNPPPPWMTWRWGYDDNDSAQITEMFPQMNDKTLYADCDCFEYYHVASLDHDFGTGFVQGENYRQTTGATAGKFAFNHDLPPIIEEEGVFSGSYAMTVDKTALLCDISTSMYFYDDVETSSPES